MLQQYLKMVMLIIIAGIINVVTSSPLGTDAQLLLSPLSHADFAAALASLPATLTRRSNLFQTSEAATLRVDVRITKEEEEENDEHYATLTKHGFALVIHSKKDKSISSITNLPVRGDSNTVPQIIRHSDGRVTVLVDTLSARITRLLKTCNTKTCLANLATETCIPTTNEIDIINSSRSQLESLILSCARGTNSHDRIAVGIWKLLYRLLFAVLTVAQLGVLAWGAAFSISFVAVEISSAAEKFTRRLIKCLSAQYTRYHHQFALLDAM